MTKKKHKVDGKYRIGQIKDSKLQSKWKGALKLLIVSGALGVFTAILGCAWFLIFNRNQNLGLIVFLFFVFQLVLFWIVASSFWQFDEKKK
jgi:hypothetical protein